jgi:hypothetical protein
MSVKFQLDNGEIKEYPTWQTDYGSEGCYPEMPYYTKCGLSFKADPKRGTGACDHLECAIDAAKGEASFPLFLMCFLIIMMVVGEWYENADIYTSIKDNEGSIIVFGFFSVLMSISPSLRWLELREYINKGTIHGIGARRL